MVIFQPPDPVKRAGAQSLDCGAGWSEQLQTSAEYLMMSYTQFDRQGRGFVCFVLLCFVLDLNLTVYFSNILKTRWVIMQKATAAFKARLETVVVC